MYISNITCKTLYCNGIFMSRSPQRNQVWSDCITIFKNTILGTEFVCIKCIWMLNKRLSTGVKFVPHGAICMLWMNFLFSTWWWEYMEHLTWTSLEIGSIKAHKCMWEEWALKRAFSQQEGKLVDQNLK